MRLSPIILSAATSSGATSTWFDAGTNRTQAQAQAPQPHQQQVRDSRLPRADFQRLGLAKYQVPAELSTEFFVVPGLAEKNELASVASVVSVPAPNRTISIYQRGSGQPVHPGRPLLPTNLHPVYPGDEPHVGPLALPLLRQQPWALPLAALSAAAMLLMAAFEVFVLFKARAAAPSRRHLFLGQALLLGLFLLAGLSAAASLTANPLSCAAFRLVGLPAALVFAALLVKCVFLLSLNSGVYLPAPYQALVLVFAVLVQVAIIGQWFFGKPPAVVQIQSLDRNTPAYSCCKTPLGQTVASLGYPGMLLLAVTCLAVRARGVRDNHREAAFIGLAVSMSLPVWVSSCIGSMAASEKDREAWLAYGLLITAILVFLTMFLPKGRQLAALGRERAINDPIDAMRDHDDRFSSLPGSGYSPSFFHFKPGEASIKSKVHCHNADVHGPVETFVLPPTMYLRSDDAGNLHTTVSSNPNVFFKRAHAGMMY